MNIFKNMSIGLKFFLASLLIVAVLFGLGWRSVNTIIECHYACMMLLGGAMNTASLGQSAKSSFYMLTEKADHSLVYARFGNRAKSEEMQRQFMNDAQTFTNELQAIIDALNADPLVDKSIIAPLAAKGESAKNRLNNEYIPLIQRLSGQIYSSGEAEETRQRIYQEFEQVVAISVLIGQDIEDIWTGISDAGDNIYVDYTHHLEGMILQHQIALIAGVVISLLLVLFLAYFIRKPFKSMMKTLTQISDDWNLTRRIDVTGKDETGTLAQFINTTFEKMCGLLKSIKKEAATLSDIGNDLASNMDKTALTVNEITVNLQNVKSRIQNQSSSVTQTNKTMEQLVENINKLSGHIENQTNNITQASSAIEEMVANIHSVTETLVANEGNVKTLKEASDVGRSGLQDVASDIQEIARESEGLLEINAVMENIASQTNLLSMNAAIEAAHAGEAGKGFAVVADEIRKLAESSSEQSKTIGTVLKKIKGSIDKITMSTNNVLQKFEAIDSSVQTVSQQEDNIRASMEEQGIGSKQILDGVAHVNEITREVKNDSNVMLEGAKEVIKESSNLESTTAQITTSMNEMAGGAENINSAVNRVNEISIKNSKAVNILLQEVARFKVE